MDTSLSSMFEFSLTNKSWLHYLFLFFAVSIPIFILVSLVAAFRTKLNKKWLWIVGILVCFVQFSMNWTTGTVDFQIFNVSFLGAGISRMGNIQPWILSFSIPIVAILFWVKLFTEKKKHKKQLEIT
ncbi:MAG: hypothetical protein RIS47_455 [Bacteroidota bacterium]